MMPAHVTVASPPLSTRTRPRWRSSTCRSGSPGARSAQLVGRRAPGRRRRGSRGSTSSSVSARIESNTFVGISLDRLVGRGEDRERPLAGQLGVERGSGDRRRERSEVVELGGNLVERQVGDRGGVDPVAVTHRRAAGGGRRRGRSLPTLAAAKVSDAAATASATAGVTANRRGRSHDARPYPSSPPSLGNGRAAARKWTRWR